MDLLTGLVGRGPRDLPGLIFPCNRMERFCVRQVSPCQSTSEGRKPMALCASSTVLACAIVVPVCSKRSVKNRSRPSNHGASVPSFWPISFAPSVSAELLPHPVDDSLPLLEPPPTSTSSS